ncbi:hypothetical protein RF11_07802 [Thelohanellus kitauei]|uniref:MULE transposase domain-containing protein n=1 Tax=Thelohanellus kitauei TaxID=669202 RepID=A0A0C2JY63_THEKT|nr:hypothetical protein RF11_07802 [Thelohanellus kitauei]
MSFTVNNSAETQEINREKQLEFGKTKRGNPTLIFQGYEYWKHSQTIAGQVTWKCTKYQSMPCNSIMKTNGDKIVSLPTDHSHEGNVARARARTAVQNMKRKMTGELVTPRSAQASIINTLSSDVKMALPNKKTISRILRRHKQKSNFSASLVLPSIPTTVNFDIPERYKNMVLLDIDPKSSNRIIIIGDSNHLAGLKHSKVWLVDGTFDKCPESFGQIYSIHYEFGNGINPVGLICLLPNKTGDTYRRTLSAVKGLISDADPEVILTDFERSVMEVFQDTFPGSSVSGCYFHLCQSILRKTNQIGLRPIYDSDEQVREWIWCLPALAHVPITEVHEAFEELVSIMPHHPGIDELLSYFEHAYIRGRRLPGRVITYRSALFPPELWNKRDSAIEGIARTKNICEGWHNSLKSLLLCHHPSIRTFFEGISKELSAQTASCLEATSGSQIVPKKQYTQLKERVIRAINSYSSSDRLTFLRAMAHISWI